MKDKGVMWKTIDVFLDRFFAVISALLFAQFPQYFQQYLMCLTGHIGELSYQVNGLIQAAQRTSKSLDLFIQKFLDSNDADFHHQGELMQALVKRLDEFSAVSKNLENSSWYARPFRLLWNLDWQVAKETWAQFQFGLVFNFETFCYLVIGIFAGYFFYQIIKFTFHRIVPESRKDSIEKI